MTPPLSMFGKFKAALYKNYGENPGTMLVHTGALGWLLSSLAQIFAVAVNDKISPEQKSFLIPQEFADAAINILSFYIVTSSFKNFASKLVSTGKLSTKSIRNALQKQNVSNSVIGKLDFNIGKLKNTPKDYKPFKNGVEVIASTIGSIASCNIITPLLRNEYAAVRQKEIVSKMRSQNEKKQAGPYYKYSMADFQNLSGGNLKI